MARYQNIPAQKRFDGSLSFPSRIIPNIPISENEIYIYSQDGDTFDSLAHKYYENSSLWWIIAAANKGGKGTRFLKPGIQIRIPVSFQQALSEFES